LASLNSKLGYLIDLIVFRWSCVHESCYIKHKMDGYMHLRGKCALNLTGFWWFVAMIRGVTPISGLFRAFARVLGVT
jgi:hypothetical protein